MPLSLGSNVVKSVIGTTLATGALTASANEALAQTFTIEFQAPIPSSSPGWNDVNFEISLSGKFTELGYGYEDSVNAFFPAIQASADSMKLIGAMRVREGAINSPHGDRAGATASYDFLGGGTAGAITTLLLDSASTINATPTSPPKIVIDTTGYLLFSIPPTKVVGLTKVVSIDAEALYCKADSASDGYNLTFTAFGPGTLLGDVTLNIMQGSDSLRTGPLPPSGVVPLITPLDDPLTIECTGGSNGFVQATTGKPIVQTLYLPPRPDSTAGFANQTYAFAETNDTLFLTLSNTTNDTIYYKLQIISPTSGQDTIIPVAPGQPLTVTLPKGPIEYVYEVTVSSDPSFDPDQGCVQMLDALTLGALVSQIDKISEEHITLSPNPTNDILTLGGMENLHGKIYYEIYNTAGRAVDIGEFSPGASERQIDVSKLPAGLYLVQLTHKDKTISKNLLIE